MRFWPLGRGATRAIVVHHITGSYAASVRDFRYLFPPLNADYRGSRFSFWFLMFITALSTARSLVHIFAPDGGANSIAGIDVDVEGGDNIIALFAQWGWEQLLLALIAWVIITRYRSLVPLALLLQVLDWGGRWAVGEFKPFVVDAPPPGVIGNLIFLPLSAIALWFALPKKSAADSTREAGH